MPPRRDLIEIEHEAAKQLAERPEHLAGFLTEQEAIIHRTEGIFSRYDTEEPEEDIGVTAPIKWQPFFKRVRSIRVHHKNRKRINNHSIIHVYQHEENNFLYFTGYKELSSAFVSRLSAAKLMLSVGKKAIHINAINNHEETHRLGSAFIQIAIEYSFKVGYEGRVNLNSTRQSGLFYFKLGFAPEEQNIFPELQEQKNVDGGDMYLPPESIEIWKKKIENNPLLPSTLDLPRKYKIHFILRELIKNIRDKKNDRAKWFGFGTDSKIEKLEWIQEWLFIYSLDDQKEAIVLAIIGAVCAIKRNGVGLFQPHSLSEFEQLVKKQGLTYPYPTNISSFTRAVVAKKDFEVLIRSINSIIDPSQDYVPS